MQGLCDRWGTVPSAHRSPAFAAEAGRARLSAGFVLFVLTGWFQAGRRHKDHSVVWGQLLTGWSCSLS